jgi:UDP-glucose 4-epimerase
MNLFLTGITGFCGSHIARRLLRCGHSIAALHRRDWDGSVAASLDCAPRLRMVRGDLMSLASLPAGTDAIIHTAAASPTPQTTIRDFIDTNIIGTERLVALAAQSGIVKFVFLSSLSLYGEIQDAVVDENTPVLNPGAYGASKLFGELALQEKASHVSSIALRLPGILGRGASRHWLATITARARRGSDITIFNPDAPFNNAVHVDDLAGLIEKLLGQAWTGFDAIALGAEGTLSIAAVAARVIESTGSSARVMVDPTPHRSFTISSEKAKAVYGYTPMTMSAMLNSYLSELEP